MHSTLSLRSYSMLPLKWFQCSSDWWWPSLILKIVKHCFVYTSLLQEIGGVMPLALCWQVVSQVPQRFRAMQASCDGYFAHQSICSVTSLHSGMARAVHPQEFSKVDVSYWCNPVWASHSTFCSKLNESARMMAHEVWLSPLEAIQHGWLLPPPLSSWRFWPYWLHCLHGWWLHLAWRWNPTLTGLWWLSHQCRL